MTTDDKISVIERLTKKYVEDFGEDEANSVIGALMGAVGIDGTYKALKLAKGRRIITVTEANDIFDYYYSE